MEIPGYRKVVGAALVAGLGLGALLGAAESASAKSSEECAPIKTKTRELSEFLSVSFEYTKACIRISHYRGYPEKEIIQYCDGNDFIDFRDAFSIADGDNQKRAVNHPACDDGKLTPTDFPKNPSELR